MLLENLAQIYQSIPFVPLIPVFHYCLIKHTSIPIKYYTTVFLISLAVLPTIKVPGTFVIHLMFPYLVLWFRFCYLLCIDFGLVKSFGFWEYIRFIISMETPKRFNLPTDPRTIKPQDLQLSYVLKYTGTGLLKYFLYSLILSYVRETRFHWNPTKLQLYQFDDPWVAIDLYLLGLALSLLLDYADHLLILPLCYIFKMEYTPIMNAVYLSCSVREFWGSRWNSMIQRGLKCSIFDPVLEALKGFPIPFKFKVTIATLLTFVFSAIMHEWCILIVCDEPTTYEQLAFFTVQAFICTFEVLVSIMFKRIFGLKIGHVFPKVVQVLWATIAVLSTSPLFLNPFIRGKVFDKFHLDYDIMKAYVERNFLK